jgi:hypothetical protein
MHEHTSNQENTQVPHKKRVKADGSEHKSGPEAEPKTIDHAFADAAPPAAPLAGSFAVPPSPSPVIQTYDLNSMEVPRGSTIQRVITNLDAVRVGKPGEDQFVQFHPTKQCYWIVPEKRETGRKAHLVHPNIAAQVGPPQCRKAVHVYWIDQYGNLGVWPILQAGKNGKIDDYSISAEARVDEALLTGDWRIVRTVEGTRVYGLFEPEQHIDALVKWPEGGIEAIRDKAYEDRVILTLDHPVLRSMRTKRVG